MEIKLFVKLICVHCSQAYYCELFYEHMNNACELPDLSFNQLHYLGTVNLKQKYI